MKTGFMYALLTCVSSVTASSHGFMGYGISVYPLPCASGCQDSVPTYVFCSPNEIEPEGYGMGIAVTGSSDTDGMDMDGTSSNATEATMTPTDACLATYVPYLQSVAYCIKTHCASSSPGKISDWWYKSFFRGGRDGSPAPIPIVSYGTALYLLSSDPNTTLSQDDPITEAGLVDEELYEANFNARNNFDKSEVYHTAYGLVVLFTCTLLPIVLSLLRFVVSEKYLRYLTAHFIDAPILERFYSTCGTRGEALLSAYIMTVNIVACFADINTIQPNAFWTRKAEATRYIENRAGVISFANIPILILFASRNNFLLWITNWNYNTFMTMHKCVAFWATIEACLHSAMYLQYAVQYHTVASDSRDPYWTWGIVATLAMSIAIVHSLPALRNAAYETFVILHRLMAVFTIVGCWYHIILRYGREYGYETWLYMAMAVWAFEHLLRYSRIIYSGLKYAHITQLDEDYIRIDIPGLSSSHYVYLYFVPEKFLDLRRFRPWESHPFSVMSSNTSLKEDVEWEPKKNASLEGSSGSSGLYEHDSHGVAEEPGVISGKNPQTVVQGAKETPISSRKLNSTFIVKVRRGLTHSLLTRVGKVPIPVLTEASYGSYWSNNILSEIKLQSSEYPNVLFIAGGVGITPLIQTMLDYSFSSSRLGRVDLYWSCRSTALVVEVELVLRDYYCSIGIDSTWGNINTFISSDSRHHLPDVISEKSLERTGTRIIVCGPDSMIREARKLTAALARTGMPVKFVSENFEW